MSVAAEKLGLRASRWSLKRTLWTAAFVAAAGFAAGWLFQSQEEQDTAGGYTEPESLNCPAPPCIIIIRGGMQRCVYPNNHLKACP